MSDIMKLRVATGAGIMHCKEALDECKGNFEKAVEYLREKGKAAAAKKESSDRINSEGIVANYIHMGGKIGVLVEINCETDFVARGEQFQELGKNIAMHIAAANPQYLDETQVPTGELDKEKEILKKQALNEGKPAAVVDKMVEGRVKKYYQDICLVHQAFVKDPSKTIKDVVTDAIVTIGEKITIRRFVRFEMGEGLEKKVDNFADEVQAQMKTDEPAKKPAAKKPVAKKK